MKIKTYILLTAALMVLAMPVQRAKGYDSTDSAKEARVKTAFLYNMMKFIHWPEEKLGEPNQPIIIGVMRDSLFGNAVRSLAGKQIKDREVVIKYFPSPNSRSGKEKDIERAYKDKYADELKKCSVLLMSSEDKMYFDMFFDIVKKAGVLTVSDYEGFMESGGIVNFLIEKQKVRFEINLSAAREGKIKISSKLLRLAKRVLKSESESKQEQNKS